MCVCVGYKLCVTRSCLSVAVNRNQASPVPLCLTSQYFKGNGFIRQPVIAWWAQNRRTDVRTKRKLIKNIKRFNSLLTSELAIRESRRQEWIKLYYNFTPEYRVFILVSKTYLQICRAPADKSASRPDGVWFRIMISNQPSESWPECSLSKQPVSRKYNWVLLLFLHFFFLTK